MKQSQCSGTTKRDEVRREVGGGFRMGAHMCTCSWLTLMYGRNYHNIVKLLFPNLKKRKESACNVGDVGSSPESERSPGEGTATHSNILPLRILWTEEPSGLKSMGLQRVRHDWVTNTHTSHIYIFFLFQILFYCRILQDIHYISDSLLNKPKCGP